MNKRAIFFAISIILFLGGSGLLMLLWTFVFLYEVNIINGLLPLAYIAAGVWMLAVSKSKPVISIVILMLSYATWDIVYGAIRSENLEIFGPSLRSLVLLGVPSISLVYLSSIARYKARK